MRLRRSSRLLTVWAALLAVLMGALAPSISHALAGKAGSAWLEVCTTSGARWLPAAAGPADQAPAPADTLAFEHCAYCSLHANEIALPTAPAALLAPAARGTAHPAALGAPAATSTAWVGAQPRAPPFAA